MPRRLLLSLALFLALAAALWLAFRPRDPASTTPPPSARAASSPGSASPAAAEPGPANSELRSPNAAALAAELSRLLALTDPDERFRQLDEFWRRWYARDRDAAFAAIAGLPPGDERSQALNYTLVELARLEPDRALTLALRLITDSSDGPVFGALFDLFARADLAGARERLARVPPGPGFEPAWRALADVYALSLIHI